MAGDRIELIAPPIVFTSPYTGLPVTNPKSPPANPYPHQLSQPVSWGYKKNNQILWAESQWNIEGTIELLPDPHLTSMSIINVMGIGKSLSGKWWASTVTHTIDSNGYTQQADLMRNAYGGDSHDAADPADQNPSRPVKGQILPTLDTQNYVLQPGDSLWSVARRFGVSLDALVKANNLQGVSTVNAGRVLVIPASS